MALKLSLKPGERVAVNGAVVLNGDRRANLVIENQARVLREGDIMQPEEAVTPAKRIYLSIMLMYLDPATAVQMHAEYEQRLTEFIEAALDPGALKRCADIGVLVANEDYYKALTACRALIAFEATRLSNVA